MYHSLYHEFMRPRKAAVGDIINSRREFPPVFESNDTIKGICRDLLLTRQGSTREYTQTLILRYSGMNRYSALHLI